MTVHTEGQGNESLRVGLRISHSDHSSVASALQPAQAFGFGGVLLDRGSADPLYRKTIRTSLAATLRLPYSQPERHGGRIQRHQAATLRYRLGLESEIEAGRTDDCQQGGPDYRSHWLETLRELHAHGYAIVALTPRAPAGSSVQEVATALGNERVALLVGNEGVGLSEETIAAADELARIPTVDKDTSSLNVNAAASIAMHHFSAI